VVSYLLGLASGVAASLVAWLILEALGRQHRRRLVRLVNHPYLSLKIHLPGRHRDVVRRIRWLFAAWEQKDADAYLDCWTNNALRTSARGEREPVEVIRDHFQASVQRYDVIRVPWTVVEDLELRPDNAAVVQLTYRMCLTRSSDQVELIEDGTEFYRLREERGVWKIHANWDRSVSGPGISDVIQS
jgi:hypothetical protein